MSEKKELPNWEEFKVYLKSQKGVKIDSGIKSRHNFIYTYFTQRPFTLVNFRYMLFGLLEGTVGKDQKLKPSAVNKYITTAKHLCKIMGSKLLDDYDTYDIEEPMITIIEPNIQRKLAECNLKRGKSERKDNYRYKCVIYTLIYTGMRTQEICNLEWRDYTGDSFIVRTSKTKKPRIVPIADKLRKYLDKLPRNSIYIFGRRNTRLYPDAINTELKRRCKQLELTTKYTAKHFRSSFDTLVSISGGEATLPKIARITGHSMETAYKHYMRYDLKVLKDALESSHPLLKQYQDIDTLKRTVLETLKQLVDMSKFDISLEIIPKTKNIRKLHIS